MDYWSISGIPTPTMTTHAGPFKAAWRSWPPCMTSTPSLRPTGASGSLSGWASTPVPSWWVIGGETRREQLALGETPNLAARLQSLAEPGTVVISATTQRLVRGLFVCSDLGAQPVKGVSAPVQIYQVLRESEAPSRLEVAGAHLTPLVSREQEVGMLLDRWEQVKDGLGQVVLVSGEAGVGKSRLVQVLKEHVATQPHIRWECRCAPYYQDSALYPVIDLIQRALEFSRDEASQEKLRKIENGLEQYGLADPDTVSLWASLLSVPIPDRYPALTLTPQRQKQKTFEAVLRLLLALAAEVPMLFVVEDLHWVDPSTQEFLDLVLRQVPTTSVLVLLTFRPDFRPPWSARSHISSLTVNRFTRKQTELMVNGVTRGKALPLDVLQQVVAKTDGVPLFVEELTKMVLESGLLREQEDRYELLGPLPPLAIPATLQDSLMARLDRLAAVKDVAQLGAALGRSFPYELLRAVSPQRDVPRDRSRGSGGDPGVVGRVCSGPSAPRTSDCTVRTDSRSLCVTTVAAMARGPGRCLYARWSH